MPSPWHNNSEDDLKLYVVLLRNDGFSDDAIGKFFKSTKGTCVGFRHRKLPKFINIPHASKPKVTQERFDELLHDRKAIAAARAVIAENVGVESPYVGKKTSKKKKGGTAKKKKSAQAERAQKKARTPTKPETADKQEESAAEVHLIEIEEPTKRAEAGSPPADSDPIVSDAEARRTAETAICAAAAEVLPERPARTMPVREAVIVQKPLPRRFIAEIVETNRCRCPIPAGGLRETVLCRATPIVYGGCCETHADLLFPHWRKKRK